MGVGDSRRQKRRPVRVRALSAATPTWRHPQPCPSPLKGEGFSVADGTKRKGPKSETPETYIPETKGDIAPLLAPSPSADQAAMLHLVWRGAIMTGWKGAHIAAASRSPLRGKD